MNTKGTLEFKKSGCPITDSNTLANRRASELSDSIRKNFEDLELRTSAQMDGLPVSFIQRFVISSKLDF